MYRGNIRMVDARCGPGFSQETAPGSFITDELRSNDLESHRTAEMGIDRLVGYSHAAMAELQRLSVLISQNLVMLETKLGRGIRNRIALGFESPAQGANWAECAVVRQQRSAHRAGSFGRGCRHRMLLASRILLDLVCSASRKIGRHSHRQERVCGQQYLLFKLPKKAFEPLNREIDLLEAD
jgi:hypothetical protein